MSGFQVSPQGNVFPAPVGVGGLGAAYSNLAVGATTAVFTLTRGSYVLGYEAVDPQTPGVLTLYGGFSATTVKFTTNTPGYVPFIVGDIEVANNWTVNVTQGAKAVTITQLTQKVYD